MLYSFGKVRVITRGKGKSAVATAAYHSGIRVQNLWDGVIHDFTYKGDVGETYIRMPANAPKRYTDESVPTKERIGIIFNDVELFEDNINAQLARQNYLALQDELTLEQNLECVDRFIKENCTDMGMGVTYTVHDSPGNLHVDMMYLMRAFDKDGNFCKKAEKEYLCRLPDGREQYMNSATFNSEKTKGWEKVYRYIDPNGEEKKMTASQAEKADGYKRKNKNPVARKRTTTSWEDRNMVQRWRESWERILNEKFEELGIEGRVSCKSLADQGIDHLPTQHVGWGPQAEEIEKLNAEIVAFNDEKDWAKNVVHNCIRNTEIRLDALQHGEPSEAGLKACQEGVEREDAVVNIISNSGVFEPVQAQQWIWRMNDLVQQVREWMDIAWERLRRLPEREYRPKDISSLDELISASEAIRDGQIQHSDNRKTKSNSSTDDWYDGR